MKTLLAILFATATAFAAPVTVSGPTVSTAVTSTSSAVLTWPVVAGNYSKATLSVAITADCSTTGDIFFQSVINNVSSGGDVFYFTSSTHISGTAVWIYSAKKGVKFAQGGTATVTFAPYNPTGATITATLTPTVTFTK